MKKALNILIVLSVLCGCKNVEQEETVVQEPIKEEIQESKETTSKISLVMAGDALTHESIYLEYKTNDGYNFSDLLSNIKNEIQSYDLAFYNQETVLGGKNYEITGYPVFNTPQEVGDALIATGFNLVSLASNHLLDYYGIYGNKLVLSQRDYFLKQKDVIAAGSYKSQEDKDRIVIGEKNGISYALLSYCESTNTKGPLDNEKYLVNFINKEEIEKDVKDYRDKVDVLMVAMHWGEEGALEENSYQREYAKFLADLGVDIIIGSHPHVLEPIEWINDTLVIYSLGNLYSNQYFNIDNLSSCLTSLDIVKTVNDKETKVEISNIKCDLIFTDLNDKHKVYYYRDLNDEQLNNKQKYIDKYTEILTKYNKDIVVR